MNEFAQFVLERLQSAVVLILLAVPLLAACLIVVYAICKKKNKPFPWKKILLWAALAGYLAVLIFVTLLRGMGGFRSVNLHLFRAWREAWNNYSVKNWLNVLLNVAMFVPLGFLLPMFSSKLQKWYAAIGIGTGLSLVIELFQFWRGIGVCDVDDLFANALGTLIGYAIIMLIISLFGKKQWNRCLSYGLVLIITVGGILGIFAVYDLKEYGNIPESAVFRADTSKTAWTLACQLPQGRDTVPVYRAKTMTKEECDAFGAAFAENFGLVFNEIMYYDKETYFIDRGGDNSTHFLFVSYLDGSYDYNIIGRTEQKWIETDRVTVSSALQQYSLQIPDDAVFSADGDGWHSFTADCLISGEIMFDGVLRCRYADDGKIYRIENNLIAYTKWGEAAIISPEEAFNALCSGNFSGGEYFERYKPENIRVVGSELDYRIDTKGFYRPVYIFDLVSTDGAYQSSVMVSAE